MAHGIKEDKLVLLPFSTIIEASEWVRFVNEVHAEYVVPDGVVINKVQCRALVHNHTYDVEAGVRARIFVDGVEVAVGSYRSTRTYDTDAVSNVEYNGNITAGQTIKVVSNGLQFHREVKGTLTGESI